MLRTIYIGWVAGLLMFHQDATAAGREPSRALASRYVELTRSADPGSAPASSVTALLAQADAARAAGNDLSALKLYDRALSIDPQHTPARAGRLLTISRLGSPDVALAEAARYPKLPADIVQRLHEDAAALAIRRSEQAYHTTPADYRRSTELAVRSVTENLKRYPQSERSRFDYVRALSNHQRHDAAIAEYETLQREQRALAGPVHYAAGTSYLARQQPEAAVRAFTAALAADRNDFNAGIGLFYALADLSEFAQARAHIDQLAARPLDPQQKFEAEIHAAWARAFEDRLALAQAQFSALQTRAPASAALHNALGTVYLWRGWPRQAEQEFNWVAQADPDNIDAAAGIAASNFAMGDYRAGARRSDALNTVAPDHHGVKKITRARTIRDLHELNFAVGSSRTKDRLSRGHTVSADTRLYSPPIAWQHRLFAHGYYETARFDVGKAAYERAGLGWETVIPRHAQLEAEIQQEFARDERVSALAGGVFDVSDYWRIDARYDSDSVDVPLRARMDDVRGHAIRLGVRYRWDERTALELGGQELAMSDTNTRRAYFISGHRQFVQGPFYKATLGLDFGASTNTLANAAYFNPPRDRTVQATLANEWLGYRRYTRAFYQRIFLAGGRYTQDGYAGATVGAVRYEHDWSLGDVTNLRYGIGYARRVFDGMASEGPEAALNMNWKF